MKKSVIISVLLMFIASTQLRGQAALLVLLLGDKAATENFHFSLKLGTTHSIIHGYDDGKNAWGFNFGLANNIRLTDDLTLVPEFLAFAPRSIRDVSVLTTGDPSLDTLLISPSSTNRKLNYIDIPVLLRWHLTERFSMAAGPQISILTSAIDTYKSSPINGSVLTTELDITPEISRLDIGMVVDIQYVVVPPRGGKGVNLYLRYGKGFMDLVKEHSGDKYTTSLIQFGAAFPFMKDEQ